MQVFNNFQEMTGTDASVQSMMDVFNLEQTDSRAIKNSIFDLSSGGTPAVTPAQPVGDRKPISEWGKKLDERVGILEQQVKNGFAKISDKLK